MSSDSLMYGYARVSSKEQNLNRQMDALLEYGVEESRIFRDKISGKNFDRPGYQKLVRTLIPGDVLVIKSIDRLGRNYDDIIEEWRFLTKSRNIGIVVLDMPLLDTREKEGEYGGITGVFIADLVLQLLSYVAQVERESIRQRQAEGIAAAKARGVKFGRPRIKPPETLDLVIAQYFSNQITRKEAAQRLGVSPATFDRWKKNISPSVLHSGSNAVCLREALIDSINR